MEIYLAAGLILSALIGISLGLIGGGGSIIIVPVLVYVLGVEANHAVDMSLTIVGVTSMIGAALHNQRGTIKLKTGALFSASGTLSAYFSSRLTNLVSTATLFLLIAILMIFIAVMMLIKRKSNQDLLIQQANSQNKFKALLAGFIVGILTGFLGIGGGFLVVPALVLFCGISMKDAVGTALMIVAIDCCAGLIGHLRYGGFDLRVTMLVTMVAIDGTLIGATLSHRISPVNLKKWFATFVILVAIFLVVKNYTALFT
ncbi:MAG: sulfite exporter TauE/SafE family protein [Candidatus Brocadia sp.]